MPPKDKDKDEDRDAGKEWFRTLIRKLRAGEPVDLGGANLPGWAQWILEEETAGPRPEGVRTAEAMERARQTGQPTTVEPY